MEKHSLFCGERINVDEKQPDRYQVHRVHPLPFREKVLRTCEKRNDEWATVVKERVLNILLTAKQYTTHPVILFK